MEWNTKWDWENHEDEIEGSFNLSGVVGGSGGSASDIGNNSSAKSSISASTESSFKDGIGIKVSKFPFQGFAGFSNPKKKDLTSPLFEASVSSGEPFIGLKLGKRTYFENSNNSKTSSFSEIPISSVSVSIGKKVKSTCQTTPIPRCQVEGCNLDLSSAKEYHRKHRVCETHSKSPKVVVSGLERRFCQQCSRFHGLSEFDEKKRSCRRRLSDHNARRRKPQHDTIQFNSTNLSSSFYGGRQQLSFVLNNGPLVQTRPWENTSMAKVKSEKSGILDGLSHSLVPNSVNLPPLKGTRVEVLDQGFKDSLTPNVDAALDIRRALSLLSNNSWGLYEPDLIALDHPHSHPHHHPQHMHTDNSSMIQHGMQSVSHSVPVSVPVSVSVSSPDYWQAEQPPHSNTQLQEFQLFNRFYSNPMDEILKPL